MTQPPWQFSYVTAPDQKKKKPDAKIRFKSPSPDDRVGPKSIKNEIPATRLPDRHELK